jgi:hypothetical protein
MFKEIQQYIGLFQAAKSLSVMTEVAWRCTVTVSELTLEQRRELDTATRGTWLHTMLHMAENHLQKRSDGVCADLREVIALTEPFRKAHPDLGEVQYVAEHALITALLELDEIVSVSLLFGREVPAMPELVKENICWVSSPWAREIEESLPNGAMRETCYWWRAMNTPKTPQTLE